MDSVESFTMVIEIGIQKLDELIAPRVILIDSISNQCALTRIPCNETTATQEHRSFYRVHRGWHSVYWS